MTNPQFLQGNLQELFDALYSIGAIEPVLKMDWQQIQKEAHRDYRKIEAVMKHVNATNREQNLVAALGGLDSVSLNFLAMEVAREFAEFQDRKQLH